MSEVLYFETPDSNRHDSMAKDHPENSDRLVFIKKGLQKANLFNKGLIESSSNIEKINPDDLVGELAETHNNRYLKKLARACIYASKTKDSYLDNGDTYVTQSTFEVLADSLSVVKQATYRAMTEKSSSFCAVRPPSHHADKESFGGFCLVNYVAYAANLSRKLGAEKVVVIDWDAHYGNGTKAILKKDPNIFYFSLHSADVYNGGNRSFKNSIDDDNSLCVNLESGTTDSEYLRQFESSINIIKQKIQPDVIVISAGFDGHIADPLGDLNLTTKVYGKMTRQIKNVWDGVPIISILEGGYDPKALSNSVVSHAKALIN